MICYALASLFFAGCLLLPLTGTEQVLIFASSSLAADTLIGLAPIVFAKFGDSRIIERLIPASPLEKILFYLVYLLIIIPLIIKLPYILAIILYYHLPSIQTFEMNAVFDSVYKVLGNGTYITNFTGNFTVIITCLYFVLTSRHNRVLIGAVAAFAAYMILAILGGIIGYFSTSVSMAIKAPEEFVDKMTQISPVMIGFSSLEIIYVVLMAVLTYRWLKRGAL